MVCDFAEICVAFCSKNVVVSNSNFEQSNRELPIKVIEIKSSYSLINACNNLQTHKNCNRNKFNLRGRDIPDWGVASSDMASVSFFVVDRSVFTTPS